MGLTVSKIWRIFGMLRQKNIFMMGLDAAGKTSIMNKLSPSKYIQTVPTIGFYLEEFHFRRITFTIWDIGGNLRAKRLGYRLCKEKDAIIFVIDSADISRLACTTMECGDCVKEELHFFLQQKEAENAPLLIYANKQDLKGAVSPEYILEKLELDRVCAGRSWYIQPCSALTGDGLLEGLKWLENEIARKRK
ncbi:Arf1k [Monocercomonoides exilis]|uniref:Arf1k n=1 Tax=Monocercomonoides exilis TaxID=2049356 RepID=UPI00355A8AFA|nr:Arf1k [Monocercomonoides exilis]|eukprot:MONOS_7047.1-p1 / transcript=MONOS_7047.1 / gene=MONOS_7047 / organism=Monocercomonoides_exilis_PA203 / gene_product=Arf1k / transcript_product=Arf1k / location=Mono_scaffold00232:60309-60954(+) / protein_length=192 / sequence_SO=supercontig / SO=protein_coding / is_pseudo=false